MGNGLKCQKRIAMNFFTFLHLHLSTSVVEERYPSLHCAGEVLEIWKKANVTPIFKEDNFTLIPGKVIVQILLEAISNPMKDKKVIWISPHGVMKGKSRLNNLTALCDEMTGFVDEERVLDVPGP
ncbi:hypothetical protein QYF61_013093 [Mycteria americana]|uniref:Uncharacterized protein n=1 Tax=Mycteria americana TaxID=33587 RepID=A0AAN7NG07_MYCAM|nr:hypothetical protein QYF61_013093 [Mycteria americana]